MPKVNFEDLKRNVQDFMRGRNGSDEICLISAALAVVLAIINIFARNMALGWLVFGLVAYVAWRMLSPNVSARRAECRLVLSKMGPARRWLANPAAAIEETRNYKHASCSHCGQRVRVPRGKGRLRVTCPKCGQKFDVRS